MLHKLDTIVASVLKFIVMGCCIAIALILFARVIIRFTPMTFELRWTDEVDGVDDGMDDFLRVDAAVP